MRRYLLCVLLLLLLLPLAAGAERADLITSSCRVTAAGKKAAELTDGKVSTYWRAKGKDAVIEITLPKKERDGGHLMIKWLREPEDYRVDMLDSNGRTLTSTTLKERFVCIEDLFTLPDHTSKLRITVPKGTEVGDLLVWEEGELPDDVHEWDPPVLKADLLLFSTHQDDELLWFGGLIPYYGVAMEKDLQIVYLCTCGRERREEALNGLWTMGIRTYPVFMCLQDKKAASEKDCLKRWGGEQVVMEKLVMLIRRFRPEVVVAQDIKGEYGHIQHKVGSKYVGLAVEAASDPERYTASTRLYGEWQVKKFYRHMGSEQLIFMDWEEPLAQLGGLTSIQVTEKGFACHRSQVKNGWSMDRGKEYDNTRFSLVFSTVGEDRQGDDLLENTSASLYGDPEGDPVDVQPAVLTAIGEDLLNTPSPKATRANPDSLYPNGTPVPVQAAETVYAPLPTSEPIAAELQPEITNAPVPDPEPTTEPTQEPSVDPELPERRGSIPVWVWIVAALLLGGAGAYPFLRREQRRRQAAARRAARNAASARRSPGAAPVRRTAATAAARPAHRAAAPASAAPTRRTGPSAQTGARRQPMRAGQGTRVQAPGAAPKSGPTRTASAGTRYGARTRPAQVEVGTDRRPGQRSRR